MVPVQQWWKAPYYWAGTKMYDFLAGSESIESSYFLPRSKAIEAFPMLNKEKIFGAMVYYGLYSLEKKKKKKKILGEGSILT